ncbi:MAG: YicC family protein [Omnitrophica bacterium]|nr:YicC family protein [Candidatus Omnitrophota bacterium]
MGTIRSMTGFGRGEFKTKAAGFFIAEIKTLNHKFLEVTPKLPNGLAMFDDKIKTLVKHSIKRGKVYLNLVHDTTKQGASNILIDEKLAKNYCNKLKKLSKKLNIDSSISLPDIISFPGVITYKSAGKHAVKLWPFAKKAINAALDELIKDRGKEGAFLCKDLTSRMRAIKEIIASIKTSSRHNVQNYKRKLSQRIKELSGNYPVDRGRLEIEVALFAKNTDITEELTRLNNHMQNFSRTIRKKGEVGKKLDFIAQELHREINTVGSKSSGFNISKGVIEVKTDVEKIREQLKNIE